MRILTISNLYPPDFIGGYEVLCQQAVDALRSRGHEVLVLTGVPRTPVPVVPHIERTLHLSDLFDPSFLAKMTPASLRSAQFASHWINAGNVNRLLQALEACRPDAVYLHNLVGLGGLGLLACLQHTGVPWVWHLGDAVPRLLCTAGALMATPNDLDDPRSRTLMQEFNRLIRGHYLLCSRRLLTEIEESGLLLQGQVELLPYWFTGVPAPRREHLQGGRLRIVTAGQISRAKGIDLLIDSARLLKERGYENFSVDIYGRVHDQTFLCMLGKAGVEGHVTFMGQRSPAELFRLYPQYDVFAFPTWPREPFGCAPLEAAAQGCVPILSNVCGISEWLVDQAHCIKVERSAEAFADELQRILDGKTDLKQLAHRSGNVVRENFHLDVIVPRIERALEQAARSPRHGAASFAETYRLAVLAEKLTAVFANQSQAA